MDLHSGVTVESQLVSQLDCCRPVAHRSSGGASSTISPCSVAKSLKTDVVRNEGSRINTRVLTSAKLLHVKSQSPQLSTDHHWSMVKPVPAPWCDQSPRWSAILGDIVPKPATESVKVPQRTYYIYNISTNNHKYTWWFWGVRLESEMAHVKISLFCRDQRCTAMPCRKPKINLDGAAAGVGQHGQLPRYCVRWWETWHSQNIGEWPAEFEHRFEHRLQPQCTIFMYCSWIRIPVYICVLKKTQIILLNQKMNMIPLDFQVYFQTNPAAEAIVVTCHDLPTSCSGFIKNHQFGLSKYCPSNCDHLSLPHWQILSFEKRKKVLYLLFEG